MKAREYLEQYKAAQRKADSLRARYDELVAQYDSVGSSFCSEAHGSDISKPTERKVERAAAALEAWRMAQLDALEVRQNVYALIEALPGVEADVLVGRYLHFKTWDELVQDTELSRTGLFKIHNRALEKAQALIDGGALDLMASDIDAYFAKYINSFYYLENEE